LRERSKSCLRHRNVVRHEHADAPYPVALLRPRHEGPRHRAPEPCDELPPPHPSSREAALSIAYPSWGCMSGLEVEVRRSFLQRGRPVLARCRPARAPRYVRNWRKLTLR
jgi:hypothetical protein